MRIYYIEKVEDDICYLRTRSQIYTETVNIADLKEFTKNTKVVGYNPVTDKVKVVEKDAVLNYINSMRKLLGKKPLGDDLRIYSTFELKGNVFTITENDEYKSYDTDGYDYKDLYNTFVINWSIIERDIELIDMYAKLQSDDNSIIARVIKSDYEKRGYDAENCTSHDDFRIILDIGQHDDILSEYDVLWRIRNADSLEMKHLTIEIADKSMFKLTRKIYPQLMPIKCNSVDIDYSGCEFHPDLDQRALYESLDKDIEKKAIEEMYKMLGIRRT